MSEKFTERTGIGGRIVKEGIAGNPSTQWVVLWNVPGEGYVEDPYRPAGGFTDSHAAQAYATRVANGRKFIVLEKAG